MLCWKADLSLAQLSLSLSLSNIKYQRASNQEERASYKDLKLFGKLINQSIIIVDQKRKVASDSTVLGYDVHPRSGNSDKYIVEDRFHGANNPHKVL